MSFLDERAQLPGKVAVVIGGGGGLGRASALDLGRAGVDLELCDRHDQLLERTVAEIRHHGGSVRSEVFDARDPEALAAYFDGISARHAGRIDVLVNVVGGTFHQPFAQSNPRGWDALIRTNFTWLLHAISLAVPLMTQGGGSIINLTSIEAHRSAPGFAVYGAMKAAVEHLTRTLAVELGAERIRVNTIAPDHIVTEGLAHLGTRPESEGHGATAPGRQAVVPLGHEGTYTDIGNSVLFLASGLSSYVTGTTLHPDGGALAASGWWYQAGVGWHAEPDVDLAREQATGSS